MFCICRVLQSSTKHPMQLALLEYSLLLFLGSSDEVRRQKSCIANLCLLSNLLKGYFSNTTRDNCNYISPLELKQRRLLNAPELSFPCAPGLFPALSFASW